MLKLQEGQIQQIRRLWKDFKIISKCYTGKRLCVEEQVFNADETSLFYKDVDK